MLFNNSFFRGLVQSLTESLFVADHDFGGSVAPSDLCLVVTNTGAQVVTSRGSNVVVKCNQG